MSIVESMYELYQVARVLITDGLAQKSKPLTL